MVPFMNRGYLILNLLFLLLLSSGGVAVLMVLIVEKNEIFNALKLLIITTGTFIVVTFMVAGFAILEEVEMNYTLSETGVQTSVGEKTRWNKLILSLMRVTSVLSFMGVSPSRDQTFTEWGAFRQIVMNEKTKGINLSSHKKLLVRLFCTSETYPKVVELVEKMLPDTDLKHVMR